MEPAPLSLSRTLDRLERLHGAPVEPPPERALEHVLWENAAYLVPDEKRERAYRALKRATKLTARGILGLPREELDAIAQLGGMHPEARVERWLSIASTVQERFGGDLEAALELPPAKAKAALKRFPGIGEPGAEKILLFTRTHPLPALESNGLRVLVRLGHAKESKSYSTTYRQARAALEPYAERGCDWLVRAHLLLRRHGQELCKRAQPLCAGCPLAADCPSVE